MKLIAFFSLTTLFVVMFYAALYCILKVGSDADDWLLGDLQYMDDEERDRFFDDYNNQGKNV